MLQTLLPYSITNNSLTLIGPVNLNNAATLGSGTASINSGTITASADYTAVTINPEATQDLIYSLGGTPTATGTVVVNFSSAGGLSSSAEAIVLHGIITTLTCAGAVNTGTLGSGVVASGVSSSVPYTGGNGGTHAGQIVTSTGVAGLTATLAAGSFDTGTGSLIYTITGTPMGIGTASFALNIGGQMCTLNRTVYPTHPNICNPSNPTLIVDVTNPATGKIWMDRNLGASQVATSSTDYLAYGTLIQWGRGADGHECIIWTSSTTSDGAEQSNVTSTNSSTDDPGHSNFILEPDSPRDWRSPQNDNLWQGVGGTNNPCPSGYRLPTEAELEAERTSWGSNNAAGAFGSPLKLPAVGTRFPDGSLNQLGDSGHYWSSNVGGTFARGLRFGSSYAYMANYNRVNGYSVRCIKD